MVPGVVVNTLAAVNVLEETVVFARAAARAPEEALARRDADRLHEPVDSQQPSLSDDSLQLRSRQAGRARVHNCYVYQYVQKKLVQNC